MSARVILRNTRGNHRFRECGWRSSDHQAPAPSPKKKALLIGINYDTEPRNDAQEFTYRPFTFPSNPHNNGDGFMYSSRENFIPPDVRDAVTGPYQIYDTGRIQPMLPNSTGIVMPASARGWNISTVHKDTCAMGTIPPLMFMPLISRPFTILSMIFRCFPPNSQSPAHL
ncbi:hypothetical protein SCP_1600310 [Sparassis crispa]|uniref:Uncharacterized protein n=1 Tax=Sparassis crispa TaxID=139825 RepID=A0A401H4U1_9APHY|nr:hypothetical protein SCP_1600310 [Sparassis crispa]GBE89370.1 hypothetical protein SCP_1600310 [Sparassis crispa]